ncbi:hypothetical protein [Amaricoccus tamworthensis]|uniref:hypothetical protein n=1 Tax=Amaricoccus tamworthensis TaxID=57002 RepID=UPI003C7D980A
MLRTVQLLLPAVIPSWQFFKSIEPSPRVEWAMAATETEQPRDWREFRPRPDHLNALTFIRRMFWNPRWNESLFLVSLSERLMEEPTDHSVDEIFHRVIAEIRRSVPPESRLPYCRFRVVFVYRESGRISRDVTHMSGARKTDGSAP